MFLRCRAPRAPLPTGRAAVSFFAPADKAAPMSHSERKLLPFPREHVFCVVADVRSYPQFVPWVVRSRIITESPRYAEAELAVGFHLLSEKYVSRITMDPPKRLVVRAWLCWGGGARPRLAVCTPTSLTPLPTPDPRLEHAAVSPPHQ